MATAIFGGSFDPPHWGHWGAACGALASGRCDRVVWVPAFAPPHKLGRRREPFGDRLTMLRLLTATDGRQAVSDIEWRRRRIPSYTVDLLAALEAETGEPPLLLIGADSLLELYTWHRAAELVGRFGILTYPRPGREIVREALAEHWPEKTVEKLMKSCLDGRKFEISSTFLRFSMAKSVDWSHIISMTPPPVAEYCRRHRLYSNQEE